ncbi:MAG: hypothetical protein V8R13_09740 [Coprococcus sp.]|nr:hypothetical protein [Coprococcus catus]
MAGSGENRQGEVLSAAAERTSPLYVCNRKSDSLYWQVTGLQAKQL